MHPIKYFHSGQAGVPVIHGDSPGALLDLLRGALVLGFRVLAPTSITIADGVATAVFPSGTFEVGEIVRIDGAVPNALNGEAEITVSGVGTCSWPTTATGVVSGSITMRLAPAGWEEVFTGPSKAVFRSLDPASARFYYRIDDAAGQFARVRGFESMSNVDAGIGPFPTDAQLSGGGYLWKGSNTNATPVPWKVFASSRTVVIAIASGVTNNANFTTQRARGFGDMVPVDPSGDPWSAFVCCAGSASQTAGASLESIAVTGELYMARSLGGVGGSVNVSPVRAFSSATGQISGGANAGFGSLADSPGGRLWLSRYIITASAQADSPIRAVVPGLYRICQSGALSFMSDGDWIDGADLLPGRRLVAVATSGSVNAAPAGLYLVDATGPW